MPGIINATNVSIDTLTGIANYTSPAELMVYVNHTVFNDVLFFILFWLLAVILFVIAQTYRKEPLSNMLYAFAITSVPAMFARGVQAVILDDTVALLTDYQFWCFPLLTALLIGILWATKKD